MKNIIIKVISIIIAIVLVLGLLIIYYNNCCIKNRGYEEILNLEDNVSMQVSESMIYGTWQPLFENVLSNNSSYMLLENIFKDKDIDDKIDVEKIEDKNRYTINRDGLLLTYEYKDGYLMGIEVEIRYEKWQRWNIIGKNKLSFKEINAITLYEFIKYLASNNIGVYYKVEGNTLYFNGLENCIDRTSKGQNIEDIEGRKIEIQDIEKCLNLYKEEVGERNGEIPLYEDNLLYLDCFYVFNSECVVELNEDNIHFNFMFQNEINGKTWDIIEEIEGNEEWQQYEIWGKLEEYYENYSKTRLSEEWYAWVKKLSDGQI